MLKVNITEEKVGFITVMNFLLLFNLKHPMLLLEDISFGSRYTLHLFKWIGWDAEYEQFIVGTDTPEVLNPKKKSMNGINFPFFRLRKYAI